MPFDYYDDLTPAQQRVYRMSDSVSALRIRQARTLAPRVKALHDALAAGGRPALERATAELGVELCERRCWSCPTPSTPRASSSASPASSTSSSHARPPPRSRSRGWQPRVRRLTPVT
ncbi:hypothetical protein [Pyxidicoccus xibeiensis]|uniref:hypothetical protein n=1 Tax=Pyxidicoccus xibeiensis TaxID=2906759 RepID=UPI0020A72871|nr:hypothetical protein [Pyxidicoccus xibeiensis]MCP3139737.1 hypothetical protein [Pyxidicoccus xibeiensis]